MTLRKQLMKPLPALLFIVLAFNIKAFAAKPVELNVQIGEEIRHLDPQISTGIGSSHISINLFDHLYLYDHKTNDPKKSMVLSESSNADASVWTFKLRKDVHWVKNEGGTIVKKRPVTAHDVVYSYRRILDPKTASEYSYMLFILKNGEAFNKGKLKDPTKLGVKALDDYTVELTMAGPVPSLIQYLPHHAFGIVPKEPIEAHQEKWITKENIWTSGPFAFENWKLKDKITIVKNPHHPDAKSVQLDKVNFHFIGTYSPESVRAFKAGKLDIDYEAPPTSEIAPLARAKNLKAAKGLGTYFVRVNLTRGPLKDVRVRKALALTIPREKIVKYVMKQGEIPTDAFVPGTMPGYKPVPFTEIKDHKARIQEAKKLMAEAGFPKGKGFPSIKYLYNTSENHKKIAVVLAKEWEEHLGIKVSPDNQEWKVYLNTQKALDFDLSRSGWVADMSDPMNFLEMFITGGGNNNTGFSDKAYDQMIRDAQIEKDVTKRNQRMQKIEEILMRELPILPIFNYTYVVLTQHYISGFYATKMDQHPLKYVKIDVEKRKKLFPNLYK